jgi:hypothetical protein
LELGDRFGDLTVILQVFPESYLIAVYDHLVVGLVQLTPKLDQGDVAVGRFVRRAAGTIAAGLQIVNVGYDKVVVIQALYVTEVNLAGIQEDRLKLIGFDVLAFGFVVVVVVRTHYSQYYADYKRGHYYYG